MSKGLGVNQVRILDFLQDLTSDEGYSNRAFEISEELGLSKKVVERCLKRLLKDNLVDRYLAKASPRGSRGYGTVFSDHFYYFALSNKELRDDHLRIKIERERKYKKDSLLAGYPDTEDGLLIYKVALLFPSR
jgi:predicted transcriptional regulator